MLTVLVGILWFAAFGGNNVAKSEEAKATKFICTSIPLDASPKCPVPPIPMQGSDPNEDDLRATVMHLRETIVQQKETIVNQKETIKELMSKLSRCEYASQNLKLNGKQDPGSWGKGYGKGGGKDTMGDLPRDPSETIDQLGRSMQSLKDRLENLEQQIRVNTSNPTLPNELRDLLQRKLVELENQLLNKVAELEDEKSLLYNETTAHRDRTEMILTALLERVAELEKGSSGFKSPDGFKVSLPLRTNYMYGRIKKTLPEMYAFTICMWLKSEAAPGIGTPFSYAVPGQANEIVLTEWGNNPIELLINDKVAQLPLAVNDGKWHHVCITWTTRDGMWEAYQDGEKLGTGENLAPWHPIKPGGVIILGQEQDTVGGRFDATQAFVGEISQFNIWDRILSAEDIMNIANCSNIMPGSVIPWVTNNVEVFGGATKSPLEACEESLLNV
ncbi:neuronal pentraxin-2 [Latimeria chalumnae]|uniref:Neuronal pentraxin 2 n=1 Tax=Latimeria chalumnae TaxID=7897 RepID=H3AMP3_LATCH|nr:PREDICTED: neuronal pentraxin-2 [Latimeria chalumnae]|eukprot:XP_006000842.1 PREDICTED: neuronal pentraxin-2 [Latimeria chalumnae]